MSGGFIDLFVSTPLFYSPPSSMDTHLWITLYEYVYVGTRPPGSVSVCIHLKPYIMLYKHRELVFQRGPSREGMREAKRRAVVRYASRNRGNARGPTRLTNPLCLFSTIHSSPFSLILHFRSKPSSSSLEDISFFRVLRSVSSPLLLSDLFFFFWERGCLLFVQLFTVTKISLFVRKSSGIDWILEILFKIYDVWRLRYLYGVVNKIKRVRKIK